MKTLARGFAMMEYIVEARKPVSIRDLMELTKLDRSTVYRYINVLIQLRYVQVDPHNQGFSPAFRILELSGAILCRVNVRDVARPYLLSSSGTFSLTAHLATRDIDEVLYLDKIETQQSLPIISRIGSRAPLHCTSLGKTILAFEEPAIVREILPQLSFEQRTETSITSADELRVELERIRHRGYAIDDEENEVGVYCVAAPVFGISGTIHAAISVTGLRRQFEDKQKIIDMLRSAATEISKALGGAAMGAVK